MREFSSFFPVELAHIDLKQNNREDDLLSLIVHAQHLDGREPSLPLLI